MTISATRRARELLLFGIVITFRSQSGPALMLFVAVCLPAGVWGDTIHLKNGRRIVADTVRESGNRVEYTIGESSYAIPKSAVERIDAGGVPLVSPAPAPTVPEVEFQDGAPPAPAELQARIVHDGRVDTDAVAAAERMGADVAAAANLYAGQFERANGRLDPALRFLERARSFLPDQPALGVHLANLLLQMGRLGEAASLASRVTRLAPQEPAGYTVLGYALYQQGRLKEAIAALEASLTLQPNETVRSVLERARRESKAESEFTEQSSSHFTLRYEGGAAPRDLRRQILETLELHFNDLVRDLDLYPREPIQVVLYTDQQFFDVTHAPSWTGALNDGRIRVPISGMTQVTAELARVLKHELAHSFISAITRNRAPTWLNEGVAQSVEPQSVSAVGRRLATIYANGQSIPLNELEGTFVNFPAGKAGMAYAQSLAAVESIRETYGMSAVVDILKRIGQGSSTEAAMRAVLHSGYDQFQRELADWLRRTYGTE
jgi:tetratricopeptide (TPR) repeat protein